MKPIALAILAAGLLGGSENPALRRFAGSLTFYASFDQNPTMADLSCGDGRAENPRLKVGLEPGLYGRAMVSGQTMISYPCAKNLDVSSPGAVALWVSPRFWKRSSEPPYLFMVKILSRGRQILLGRMGGKDNEEALYAYAATKDKDGSVVSGSTNTWKSGEWHLLVLNWKLDAIELSVDGGPVKRLDTPWLRGATGEEGAFLLGCEGRPEHEFLLDEFMVLDRPLDGGEAAWLYSQRPR